MDETFHESESTAGGAVPPRGDAATAGAQPPPVAQFAPVEAPEQAVFPAGPPARQDPAGDGFPGGEIPESSGFSWRVSGQQMPMQHAQGGIPNEFDHLFRDAPQDDRRSLMPSQGTIGVSLQGSPGYPPNGAGRPQPPAVNAAPPQGPPPGPQPTQALPPAGATGPQPQYQPPTQDQIGYQAQGLPSRAYDAGGYQAQGQGYPQQAGPEYHTQAIPRVGAQPYGERDEPDLLLATAPGKRQANTTILVALGVFVVLIVVAAVAFSGGGGKSKNDNAKKAGTVNDTPAATTTSSAAPAPPGVDPEAKKQADALFQIIAQSKELRSQANGAYSNVQACKNMPANKQAFTDVATKRQAQADAVKGQAVDKLPGGQKLAQDLINAWQLSAESENDYVAWANDNLSCTGKPGANDNLAKASSAGTKAGSAKADAVKDWNAFATQLGVQPIAVGDL